MARPKGSKNKKTLVAIAKAKEIGLLPHEILLAIARGEQPIDGVVFKSREIIEAAKAAAPYYAPRLASIEHKVESEVRHIVATTALTDEEWERKYLDADYEKLDS